MRNDREANVPTGDYHIHACDGPPDNRRPARETCEIQPFPPTISQLPSTDCLRGLRYVTGPAEFFVMDESEPPGAVKRPMTSKDLVYLAAPYSATYLPHEADTAVRERRFQLITHAATRMVEKGFLVFSPITHSHPMVVHGPRSSRGKGVFADWASYDFNMIANCKAVFVLTIPGWDRSVGVHEEIEFARGRCIPVYYIADCDWLLGQGEWHPDADTYREQQLLSSRHLYWTD